MIELMVATPKARLSTADQLYFDIRVELSRRPSCPGTDTEAIGFYAFASHKAAMQKRRWTFFLLRLMVLLL